MLAVTAFSGRVARSSKKFPFLQALEPRSGRLLVTVPSSGRTGGSCGCGHGTVRSLSSSAARWQQNDAMVATVTNPDLEAAAASSIENLAVTTSGQIPTSYSPITMVQQYVIWMHDSLGAPWWASVGLLALTVRVAVLPMQAYATMYGSRFVVSTNDIDLKTAKFNEAITLRQKREVENEVLELLSERKLENVHRASPMYWLAAAGPLHFLSMYSLYSLSTTPSMLPALSAGGLLWLSDLTVRDPFGTLSVASMLMSVITSRTLAEKGLLKAGTRGPTLVFAGCFNLLVGYFGTSLVQLYWLCACISHVLASLSLRLPPVARALDIPSISSQLQDHSFVPLLQAMPVQRQLPPVEELRAIAAEHREALAAGSASLPPPIIGRWLSSKPVRVSFLTGLLHRRQRPSSRHVTVNMRKRRAS
ncbi:cytochrome c oxidase assembly protein COX18, mitochondrial-like [Sycon ciliatum]|uniref:cytochrome c oxidase assembly protein COX18, mitochondrial-like n=1 Tax=Sycon ciliatum TaxID=27933 RepID=UPI0031F6156B